MPKPASSKGEERFAEMLSWAKPRISERKMFGSAAANNRRRLAGDRRRSVTRSTTRRLPSRRLPKPEATQPRTGKKIVVVDDTEMLFIFVEDVLRDGRSGTANHDCVEWDRRIA